MDTLGWALIFKTLLTIKYIEIKRQTSINDIKTAPPSINLVNNVVPVIPKKIAIILNILSFIVLIMLSKLYKSKNKYVKSDLQII